MLPSLGTWEVWRKNGHSRQFLVTVNDGAYDVAYDISTWAVRFLVKTQATDTDAEAVIDVAGTIVDGPGGEALVTLTGADTDLAAGSYHAEVRFTPAGGESVSACGRLVVGQRTED